MDETTNIAQAHALFNALKPSTRILLVGDADQLPSVGPGNVFKNIIESNAVPVVTLKTIFRQAQASSIVKDAHLINKSIAPSNMRNVTVNKDGSGLELVGESLVSESDHTKGDVLYFSENDPERAIDVIEGPLINFIREQGYNVQSDVQFLAPMMRGHCGTNNICRRVQGIIHRADDKSIHKRTKYSPNATDALLVGDRVMQDANDYALGVWNGEIGIVVEKKKVTSGKDKGKFSYKVEFPDSKTDIKVIEYSGAAVKRLKLAYACTIHKSQGSEFPVVVIPVFNEHYHMLSKNLLYTALTRAESLAILIGSKRMLNITVKKVDVAKRETGLKEQIQSAIEYYENGNIGRLQRGPSADGDLWAMLELESSVVLSTYPQETKGSDQESHEASSGAIDNADDLWGQLGLEETVKHK